MSRYNRRQFLALVQFGLYNMRMRITKAGLALRLRLTPSPTLTQAQVADHLGVTQQAVSAWMRGVATPDGVERRAALEALTGVAAADWDVVAADESGEHLAVDHAV